MTCTRPSLALAAAAFALCSLSAPAAAQSTDTVYQLHGSVVNGVTSAPIARALVQSSDRRIAIMTDSEGRFSVDLHVPAKTATGASSTLSRQFRLYTQQVILTPTKPGYLPAQGFTSLTIDDTLSATDVRLKLMPAAVIDGRISAAGAEDAANVRVFLLMRGVDDDGNRNWVQAGFHQTNARGEFRFTDLRPGDYTVMTADWAGPETLPHLPSAVIQCYPPVYSGDTSSLASAVKIRIRYGETAQAELHLHPATYYPVTVPVTTQPPSNFVQARIADADPGSGFLLNYNARLGVVQSSLPNGHYTLLLNGNGPQPSFASVEVNVAGAPVRTAAVALSPIEPVHVRVHTQFTAQPSQQGTEVFSGGLGPTRRFSDTRGSNRQTQIAVQNNPVLQLQFRPEDTRVGSGGYTQPGATPDELVAQNLQPGRYHVRPQVFRGYVSSLTADGVDLLQHPLIIHAGEPPPLDVVVRDDTATLNGTITSASGPLPQQMIVALIPMDSAARYAVTGAGADGTFLLPSLAPGSYRALAFRALQHQIPYRDPEFMRRFDGKGTTVNATPGQQLHVDIALLDDADAEEN